jgi:hypothetical protein
VLNVRQVVLEASGSSVMALASSAVSGSAMLVRAAKCKAIAQSVP